MKRKRKVSVFYVVLLIINSNGHPQAPPTSSGGASSSDDQPPTKQKRKTCHNEINEIFIGHLNDIRQFIEIKRFCPTNVPLPAKRNLDGYYIAVLELGVTPKFLLTADLSGARLTEVYETPDEDVGTLHNFYFVLGTKDTSFVSLSFGKSGSENTVQYTGFPSTHNVLPPESDTPVAVLLLYLTTAQRTSQNENWTLLKFPFERRNNVIQFKEFILGNENKDNLKGKIVDYVVYGRRATYIAEGFLKEILEDGNFVLANNILSTQTRTDIVPPPPFSYSRCSDYLKRAADFQISIPTPMKANKCDNSINFEHPFSFKYKHIQHTGQELIINALQFIHANKDKHLPLEGSAAKIVSDILGVPKHRILGIQRQHGVCELSTPKHRGVGTKYKQEQIDDFDKDKLRSIIADFFKNYRAPTLNDVYQKFLDYKRDNCVTYTTSQEAASISRFLPLCTNADDAAQAIANLGRPDSPIVVPCRGTDPSTPTTRTARLNDGFSIGKKTFVQVLKSMGFHYGRIDKRVALVQRADILKWRGRFLKILKDNEDSSTPLKVTYLDETWIDPNEKSGKGWTFKRPVSFKQCRKYSYPSIKQGHGPRIIVLAAGDDDGIISESVDVYAVQKNAQALDYHENVNKEKFINWFKKLLDIFDARGERHIIVIDNAPYHSSMIAPKSADKKQVLYDWLEKLKNNDAYNVQIPLSPSMRKWELWALVQSFKKNPQMQSEVYELDRLASSRGHKIVRLPPYMCVFNPIEFCWNHVKRIIADENLTQNVADVIAKAYEVLQGYDSTKWKNYIKNCKKLRDKYWEEDGYMENEIPNLVVPLDGDDTDEDEYADGFSCQQDDTNNCSADLDELDIDEIERGFEDDRDAVAAFHRLNNAWPETVQMRPQRLFQNDNEDT